MFLCRRTCPTLLTHTFPTLYHLPSTSFTTPSSPFGRKSRKKRLLHPLTITGWSYDLHGFAHLDGQPMNVFHGLKGESVEAVVEDKLRKGVGKARAVNILTPHPDRVTPFCPHYLLCGGCHLQHLSYTAQAREKEGVLVDQIRRIGKCVPEKVDEKIVGPERGYRRKARVTVQYLERPPKPDTTDAIHAEDGNDDHPSNPTSTPTSSQFAVLSNPVPAPLMTPSMSRIAVGFRTRYHSTLRMHHCDVLHPLMGNATMMESIRVLILSLSIPKDVPQLEMVVADRPLSEEVVASGIVPTLEPLLAIVIRHVRPLTTADLDLIRTFGAHHRAWVYVQPSNASSVRAVWQDAPVSIDAPMRDLVSYVHVTYPSPHPPTTFRYDLHPLDFLQVNRVINDALISRAMAYIDRCDVLIDAFCGIGNFTLPASKLARCVLGMECEFGMIERAKDNAKVNGLTNVEFMACDLFQPEKWQAAFEQQLQTLLQRAYLSYPASSRPSHLSVQLLLDPPRSGSKEWLEAPSTLWNGRDHVVRLTDESGRTHAVTWHVGQIVYVSCNPSTLARDADTLTRVHGFRMASTAFANMFPHTAHSEAISVFQRERQRTENKIAKQEE